MSDTEFWREYKKQSKARNRDRGERNRQKADAAFAEAEAERQAAEAKLAEERAAREKIEAAERERQAAEAARAEAERKRAADEQNRAAVFDIVVDAILVKCFRNRVSNKDDAIAVAEAIVNGEIPHVTITY